VAGGADRHRPIRRITPFSSLDAIESEQAAVDPSRFNAGGHWVSKPADWRNLPEAGLLNRETIGIVRQAVEALPPRQAQVIAMRDIAGFSAEEVAGALGVTPGNQRILLHRARSRVRAALEEHIDG
jgi:RNA polymerase sigma-70 factor (ECF subfamily)